MNMQSFRRKPSKYCGFRAREKRTRRAAAAATNRKLQRRANRNIEFRLDRIAGAARD